MSQTLRFSQQDSNFLTILRGSCIVVIVFGHTGGFWLFRPFTSYLHSAVPIFFFISGAVSYVSYVNNLSLRKGTHSYLIKRAISLLIPYYLLCLICLCVYLFQNVSVPNFDLIKLKQWLQITPQKADRPFPIGQVWFLNSLLFITLLSPLFFSFLRKNKALFILSLITILMVSFMQMIRPINEVLSFSGNDLYRAIVYGYCFMLGAFAFQLSTAHATKFAVILLAASAISIFVTKQLLVESSALLPHIWPPNFYYMAIFTFLASTLLLNKAKLSELAYSFSIVRMSFSFLHKHTFSIFILHTFSIYLVEVSSLLQFISEPLIYGICKFILVFSLTSFISIPFTFVSQKIVEISLTRVNR